MAAERTKDEDDRDGEDDGGDGAGEAIEKDGQRLHGQRVPEDEGAEQVVVIPHQLHAYM